MNFENRNSVNISIIIASYNSRNTIEACLDSIKHQIIPEKAEVILVDSSTDGTEEIVRKKFSFVKLFHFSNRKYCGEARNIGVTNSCGNIIAFLDADCIASDCWLKNLRTAHQLPFPAISGVMDIFQNGSNINWAYYFCEFYQWMPGSTYSWLEYAPGGVTSYKKWIFRKYGSFIEGRYGSDQAFHWIMAEDRKLLKFSPSIIVSHLYEKNHKEFLSHMIIHGRSCSEIRRISKKISVFRRLFYILASPIIPVKMFLNISTASYRTRNYLKQFLKVFPLVIIGLIFWTIGDVIGNLTRSSHLTIEQENTETI